MDAILILGAAVWADGPSPTLKRRTLHAATLWHSGVAPLLVPCGGLGRHSPTEAAAMRDILRGQGIPDTAIMIEDRSTDTLENIRYALPHLKQNAATRVTIVTDLTHGPRAAMVARHFGLTATVSSPSLTGGRKRTVIRQALRECGAIPVYFWRLRRIPKQRPTARD